MRVNRIGFEIRLDGTLKQEACVKLFTDDLNAVEALEDKYVNGKPYTAEIERERPRRSLDANAYMWVLLDKISKELALHEDLIYPPQELYKKYIREYGESVVIPMKDEELKTQCRKWEAKGLGACFDILGPCVNFPGHTNVKCYWGSSTYNTAEMSRLLDGIVQEARELNIETLPPDRLEELKQLWE